MSTNPQFEAAKRRVLGMTPEERVAAQREFLRQLALGCPTDPKEVHRILRQLRGES